MTNQNELKDKSYIPQYLFDADFCKFNNSGNKLQDKPDIFGSKERKYFTLQDLLLNK